MNTTAEDLSRKAHDLCLAVAPELATRPFYVIPMSALPPELASISQESDGLAGPALDRVLCGVIGEAWEGRGPAILVKTDGGERNVLSVALHECGHVLREPWHHCDESDEDALKAAVELVMIADRAAQGMRGDECFTENARGHDAPWFRCCCHLFARARRFGVQADLWFTVPSGFGPTVTLKMIAALTAECVAWRDWPIARILEQPYPPRFAALWRRCRPDELNDLVVTSTVEIDPMNVLEKIIQKLSGRQAEKAAGYRDLVAMVADAREPKIDALESAMLTAGKTKEDFDRDVRLLLQRRELAGVVARSAAVDAERVRLAAQARALNDRLAAAQRQHELDMAPVAGRLAQLDQEAQQIIHGAGELKRLAAPELHARARDIDRRLTALHETRKRTLAALETTRSQAALARQKAEVVMATVRGLEAPQHPGAAQAALAADRRADRLIGELGQVDQQTAALEAEAAALEQQMLQP